MDSIFGDKVRVPLGPNEYNNPPAPGPVDYPEIVPSESNVIYSVYGFEGGSPSAACQAYANSLNSNNWVCGNDQEGYQPFIGQVFSVTESSCTYGGCGQQMGTVSVSKSSALGCPSGYSMSGGSCVMNDPRQFQDDKTCDILFKNGQFSTAGDLNCAATTDGSSLQPLIRDGNIIAYGTNSDGQPIMWTVTPGVQGATVESYWYVRQSEQIQTDIGSMVKTTTVAISPDTSTITSVSSSTSPGSISFPSGSGSPGVAPSIPTVTDPVTNPTSPENTPTVNTQPGLDTIVFPNDYARTGEASKAADKIVDKLDSFSNPAEPTQSDPEIPDDSNFDNSFFKNVFDPLLGWKLPSHESICPVANFDLFNQSYVMDAHCLIAENNRAALSSIMMVAWVLVALFIVLKA